MATAATPDAPVAIDRLEGGEPGFETAAATASGVAAPVNGWSWAAVVSRGVGLAGGGGF